MILWLMVLVACIKYVVFILKADHFGEGGTFALVSNIPTHFENPRISARFREMMFMLGMVG